MNIKNIKIKWNKVTWYSKLLTLILIILLPFFGFYLGMIYQKSAPPPTILETEIVKKDTTLQNQKQQIVNQNLQQTEQENIIDTFKEEKSKDEEKTTETTNEKTDVGFNRDCGKPTIIVLVYTEEEKAKKYFVDNNLIIQSQSGSQFILKPPDVNKAFWIKKINQDGIGSARYDTIGCDFVQ